MRRRPPARTARRPPSSPRTDALSLITTTEDLAAACARMAHFPFVTVDTEFHRETTFWPILCVVQVASDDEALAIDALAPGIDLAPLFALMADPDVRQGFPRRAPGCGDFLEARRRGAGADVRHPGCGDGLRLWRTGFLQRAGALDHAPERRQVVPLHRLAAPAARQGADRIRHRRRHPFTRHLSHPRARSSSPPAASSGSRTR